jgi:methylated-DNA-[protein]-cysteine S-methyltransferase
MKYAFSYRTPVGQIFIAEENGAVTELGFAPVKGAEGRETALLRYASDQLSEYFLGQRRAFDLPLKPSGTPFQKDVWSALRDIPYGQTCAYRDVAAAVGNPKACRAVGMANNKNPIAIVIPCHRVVGADGRLVGYGGGLDIKRALLGLEEKNK